jgi:hypothetical protein
VIIHERESSSEVQTPCRDHKVAEGEIQFSWKRARCGESRDVLVRRVRVRRGVEMCGAIGGMALVIDETGDSIHEFRNGGLRIIG